MSTTWTFAEFVDQLKTQLEALPALLGLEPVPEVRVSVPHAAEDISDIIALGIEAIDDKEKVLLGQATQDEEVSVGCLAAVVRYGSGDEVALEARDRALLLSSLVDEQLRTTPLEVGTQTLRMIVTNREFESFPTTIGEDAPARVARVRFDINYRARTNP